MLVEKADLLGVTTDLNNVGRVDRRIEADAVVSKGRNESIGCFVGKEVRKQKKHELV